VEYDAYGRVEETIQTYGVLDLPEDRVNVVMTNCGYVNPAGGFTSTMVHTMTNTVLNSTNYQTTYIYTYDANRNILSISDETNTTSYVYEGLGQLIRENSQTAGKNWMHMYVASGNITQKCEYAYTTDSLINAVALDTSAYG